MDEAIVRTATLKDLEILLTFEQGVIEAERPFDITLKTANIRYYDIEEMITASHIELAVAELNNIVIASGYARIEKSKLYLKHKEHAYLGFMYVDAKHRGKGINKKIIEFLEVWAHAHGITEIRLDVYFHNKSALKAYQKIGFCEHMIEMRKHI